MNIKRKSPTQVTIRQSRIEACDDSGTCKRLVEIWHRKGWLVDHEKEVLEQIIIRRR